MSLPDWTEAPLARHHDRKAFDCGEAALNEYLARYARQNHESGGAKTFIASPLDEPSRVLGYYTLAPASLAYARAPSLVRRGSAGMRFPCSGSDAWPSTAACKGRGSAVSCCSLRESGVLAVAEQVGGVALLIDAKSERAAGWYRAYGAVALEDAPLSLILPLATIAAAVSGSAGISSPPRKI